jgi:hypothetical protein
LKIPWLEQRNTRLVGELLAHTTHAICHELIATIDKDSRAKPVILSSTIFSSIVGVSVSLDSTSPARAVAEGSQLGHRALAAIDQSRLDLLYVAAYTAGALR